MPHALPVPACGCHTAGMPLRTLLFAGCVLTLAGCGGGRPHSTLTGVYSSSQATQGKDVYEGLCISCHAGMGNHTGPVFRTRWAGHDLQEMYRFISQNMPKNDPGSLAPEDYTAVMAYLLQMNGMPAGKNPLPADTLALKAITFDTAAATH
jgi:mono/diheme cytochrome c family protein